MQQFFYLFEYNLHIYKKFNSHYNIKKNHFNFLFSVSLTLTKVTLCHFIRHSLFLSHIIYVFFYAYTLLFIVKNWNIFEFLYLYVFLCVTNGIKFLTSKILMFITTRRMFAQLFRKLVFYENRGNKKISRSNIRFRREIFIITYFCNNNNKSSLITYQQNC